MKIPHSTEKLWVITKTGPSDVPPRFLLKLQRWMKERSSFILKTDGHQRDR